MNAVIYHDCKSGKFVYIHTAYASFLPSVLFYSTRKLPQLDLFDTILSNADSLITTISIEFAHFKMIHTIYNSEQYHVEDTEDVNSLLYLGYPSDQVYQNMCKTIFKKYYDREFKSAFLTNAINELAGNIKTYDCTGQYDSDLCEEHYLNVYKTLSVDHQNVFLIWIEKMYHRSYFRAKFSRETTLKFLEDMQRVDLNKYILPNSAFSDPMLTGFFMNPHLTDADIIMYASMDFPRIASYATNKWYILTSNQKLLQSTIEYMLTRSDALNWYRITQNKNISIDFYRKHIHHTHHLRNRHCYFLCYVSENYVRTLINMILSMQYIHHDLYRNPNIPIELFDTIFQFPDDIKSRARICGNASLNLETIRKYIPADKLRWDLLLDNPSVTEDDIISNLNQLDYSCISHIFYNDRVYSYKVYDAVFALQRIVPSSLGPYCNKLPLYTIEKYHMTESEPQSESEYRNMVIRKSLYLRHVGPFDVAWKKYL